ncbi:GNAT family N-acetyltransferase [Kinneretia aquatilis]|uniref:GNAT family N-acetyltransferase n=1 Tax=Kinneretia aquatilis TaxID=2070761 RepID=UPI001057595F
MPDFPLLQTPRLLLREITEADAEDLFRIHSDARHMAWFGSDPLKDLSEAKRLIATFASWRQLPNLGVRWGLQLKEKACPARSATAESHRPAHWSQPPIGVMEPLAQPPAAERHPELTGACLYPLGFCLEAQGRRAGDSRCITTDGPCCERARASPTRRPRRHAIHLFQEHALPHALARWTQSKIRLASRPESSELRMQPRS